MTPQPTRVRLRILEGRYGVSRLDASATTPAWVAGEGFVSVTRTTSELSVVCREDRIPPDVRSHAGYVALEVEGPLAPELVGVLASLATPLAAAAVPILAIGTFDTDYVLVRARDLARALAALEAAGHELVPSRKPPSAGC